MRTSALRPVNILACYLYRPDTLYAALIHPFFATNEETIDTALARAQEKKEELQPIIENAIHERTEQIKSALEKSVETIKDTMGPVGITKRRIEGSYSGQKQIDNNQDDLNDKDESIYDSADTIHQRRVKMQSAEKPSTGTVTRSNFSIS